MHAHSADELAGLVAGAMFIASVLLRDGATLAFDITRDNEEPTA